jgi:hypothetical protein
MFKVQCSMFKVSFSMQSYPKGVTPECLNRGSSPFAWIPDGSRASPSRGKSRDRSIRE